MTPKQEAALNWLVDQLDQAGVSSWAESAWEKAVDRGAIRHNTKPGEPVSVERLFTFLERMGAFDQAGDGVSAGQVKALAVEAVREKLD